MAGSWLRLQAWRQPVHRSLPLTETRPKRVVILSCSPSMEALRAWRSDPAYVRVRAVGEKYATYHTFAVEGAAAN